MSPAADVIEEYGGDDDTAGHNFLHPIREAQLRATVGNHAHDHGAHERSHDAALTARQTRSANDDGCDDVEFETDSGGRIATGEIAELQDGREAGKRRAQRVNEQLHALNGNTAESRREFTRAHRKNVPAKTRVSQRN